MKRYFTFSTPPDTTTYRPRGLYHYVSLPGQDYICVVEHELVETPNDWTELTHLLGPSAANFNGINGTPGEYSGPSPAPPPIGGVLITDSMYKVAKKIGKIHKHFKP